MNKKLKNVFAALGLTLLLPAAANAQQTSVVFSDDFSSGNISAWTVIDVNNDSKTWAYMDNRFANNQGAAGCLYGTPGDDWLITPALNLTAGREYTLRFKYGNAGYGPDKMTVAMGREATVEGMTTTLLAETDVNNEFASAAADYTKTVTVDEDGVYYIGIHSTGNDTFYLIIDDFAVETSVNTDAPAAPAIEAVAGEQGALKVDLTITCPTTNAAGGELTSPLTKVVLNRDGEMIKTWEGSDIAATLTYTDNDAKQGVNTYAVSAFNESGESPAATAQVKAGVDVPTPVQAFITDDEVDGVPAMTAQWEAVSETGANGGYVNPQLVKYNIYDIVTDYYSTTTQLKATTEEGATSFNFGINPDEGEQKDIARLYAIAAENAAGQGDIYYIGGIRIIGEPYMLPFEETVAQGKNNGKLWWSEKSSDYSASWYTNSSETYNDEQNSGSISWTPTEETDLFALNTGKISLEGAVNPVVRFAVKSTPATASKVSVAISKQSGDDEVLATIDFTEETEEGWKTAKADLKDFLDSRYVIVKFIFEGVKGTTIYLDDIHVEDELSDNLALKMDAPASTIKGSETKVNITVENTGSNAAADYTVKLFADNEEVWSATESESLQSHSKKAYEATFVPTLFDEAESLELKAVVEWSDDLDEDDNEATATVELKEASAPQPENLQIEGENGGYTLTWNGPSDLLLSVTDDFESYKPNTVDAGENTSDEVKGLWGEWTTYDKDGAWTDAVFNTKLPFEGYKYAYVLFNPSLYNADLLAAVPALNPHSGNQYMMAVNNYSMWTSNPQDNWLISPELTGIEQEISFWARSYSEEYPETYIVRYSTTDTQESSFAVVEAENAEGTLPAEWTEVKVTVPEGTKYFAICQSTPGDNAKIFMLDDVTYYTSAGEVVSYNIYLDGELIGNVPAGEDVDFSYLYSESLSVDTHDFSVAAVYANGQQSQPVSVSVVITGIGNVESNHVSTDGKAYSISGQAVGKNYRGIIIVNGKKVVKK
ncbi:MAG: choice-of-anchor J domain-containing protein [Prevotella sp.]|nr:choice-of-anchor J domain-containing protein [Prevotella sp.]